MKFVKLFVLMLMFSLSDMIAQDAMFSQYFASGQYFNPSLVATETSLTLSGITRTQWKSVDATYQTSMIGVTIPIKDKFEKHKRLAGVNVSIINDESSDGALSELGVNVSAAYGLSLSKKNTVFFGLMGGYVQKSINHSDFRWGEQFDPTLGWDPTQPVSVGDILEDVSYFDMSAGLLAVHDLEKQVGTDRAEIYFGLAGAHLTSPNNSLLPVTDSGDISKLPLKLTTNIGALLPIKEHIGISPNVMFVSQGQYQQVNMGVYGTYYFLNGENNGVLPNAIEFGTWYRLQDSFIFNVGVGNEVYHIGFSMDLTTSNLNYTSGTNNAYEISFKLQKPHKKAERHYTPRF